MPCPFPPCELPAPESAGTCLPDLPALQPILLRYARSRLRNAAMAEDAVSETMVAAWKAQTGFATEAQGAKWVFGILRHKLVDQLRQQARETAAGDALPEADTRSLDWFVGGAWCGVTSPMAEPDQAFSQRQFIDLVLRCCKRLPPVQAQAFLLRELHGDEPSSICARLNVTEGHLWVLIHRARVRLRVLLAEHWTRQPKPATAGRKHAAERPGGRPWSLDAEPSASASSGRFLLDGELSLSAAYRDSSADHEPDPWHADHRHGPVLAEQTL